MAQPEVAVRRPPGLKGFFANGTDTDYFRHIVMFGGAPQVDFLTLWMGANFTEGQESLHVPSVVRAAMSYVFTSPLKRIWAPAIQKRMSSIMDSFKNAFVGGGIGGGKGAGGGVAGIGERINSIRKDTRERCTDVLTSDQKRMWEELVGDDFNIELPKIDFPDLSKKKGKGGN